MFAGDTAIDCRAATAVVFAVAELFVPLGSVVGEVTEAVLAITVPPGVVRSSFTTRAMLTVAPLAIGPALHVTVLVPAHDPPVGVTDTYEVWAGTTSVTVTLGASDGPLFVTGMA